MNYRSNLGAPDLRLYFKHIHERVEPNSQGHTVISDFADKADNDPIFGEWKRCWFWSLDEAAILYHCAKQIGGRFVDIGAHTGWTAAVLASAGCSVVAVDPLLRYSAALMRFEQNTEHCMNSIDQVHHKIAAEYFAWLGERVNFDGFVIDGNHSTPCPLDDAQNSAAHLNHRGIVLLHDYRGEPIKESYRWLLANGFQGRTYTTPNGVAVCWRGEFTPPEHVPDPKLAPCE